jgi:ClpP class serine protease
VVLFYVFGQRDTTQKARDSIFHQFQSERKSRVIALIHRQESQSIFGVQVSSFINIEDSEAVLRAIRLTPDDQPIDLILHTPGGSFWRLSKLPRPWPSTRVKSLCSSPTTR